MTSRFRHAPSLSAIEKVARRAFETIPEELRENVRDVVIHVAEFPDDAVCDELGLESPFDLLGLYSGVPIGDRESAGTRQDVDRIYLYRRPILDYWCDGEDDLAAVVRNVLIHEIGHHFGFSDADMAALEAQAAGDEE
jgi:predicted Zn-dependent protease with MMP-like domain